MGTRSPSQTYRTWFLKLGTTDFVDQIMLFHENNLEHFNILSGIPVFLPFKASFNKISQKHYQITSGEHNHPKLGIIALHEMWTSAAKDPI